MAIRTRDLTKAWRRDDAERMARFMNESGQGWPDGGWDPRTPEEIEREFRESRVMGAFVAEVGDRVVAFCNVAARPGERNRAYIPFLNAHPDFHGKGFGKAVLLSSVERVYDEGIARVDLHTWPGNLKAVPLYKKSGFMWAPDHPWGVLMQNFTPGARRHPVAQAYFRKHDWYRTMKRDLRLVADEHCRGKVKVYPYEWEAGGDRLRMVYDRQSWGLLEIENNDFLVASYLEDEKLVAGLPHTIRWRVVNHGSRPLEVALVASGDEGITLDHKQIMQVEGRAEAAAEFEIDPEIAEKDKEPRAQIVRSDIIVNGMPIRLEAGFEVKQAVHFGTDKVSGFLRPGRAQSLVVQCSSELDRPARARVRIRGAAGAGVKPASATVELPARGSTELPIEVTAAETGVAHLRAEAEVTLKGRKLKPKAGDLYLHAGAPGQVLGRVEHDTVYLESAGLSASISRRGGWLRVDDKARNLWQVAGMPAPQIGPPFAWEDFFESRCEARIEHEPGRVVAILSTPSAYHPGLWLERRIALSNLPLVEVRDTLINGSPARVEVRLRSPVQLRGDRVAMMTAKGIVRDTGRGGGRWPGEHRLGDKGSDWPEGWIANEDPEGITAGLLWERADRVEGNGGWNMIEQALPAVKPGQSAQAGPLFIFAGDGDFFTVRRWWQRLFGPMVVREQRRPKTRVAFEFGLRPDPLVLHGREARAKLAADSLGQLKLQGKLSLSAPEGLRVRPRSMDFRNVSAKRGAAGQVAVSRSASLPEGAYPVECTGRLDRAIYRERNWVIALGDASAKVTVARAGERGELFQIGNGVLALTVAPGFQGSAISLERAGAQLLRSAYPEARSLAWENPWFGGIQPGLGSVGRELFKERFTAREVERRGRQGILWRGLRLTCSPKEDRGRNDRLALDYLLAPGSDILAVVVRTTRRTGTSGWIEGGFTLWPVLAGSYLDAVLSASSESRTSRVRCDLGGGLSGDRWVIAEHPKAGQAVLMACRGGESGVGGVVFGRDGYFLNCGRRAVNEAQETRESVFYVCFTETPRARDLAEALSQLQALP